MADKNVNQKPALDFKTSRQKKITVITNSLIFILLSVCAFGFYSYNSIFLRKRLQTTRLDRVKKI